MSSESHNVGSNTPKRFVFPVHLLTTGKVSNFADDSCHSALEVEGRKSSFLRLAVGSAVSRKKSKACFPLAIVVQISGSATRPKTPASNPASMCWPVRRFEGRPATLASGASLRVMDLCPEIKRN